MTALAYPAERMPNPLAEVGERIRNRIRGWLGRSAVTTEVQTVPEVQTLAAGTFQRELDASAPWADPWANAYQQEYKPQPYMVAAEGGGARYETREEQRARMTQFHQQHPGANAYEAHAFEYSGVVPDTLANREAYDNANPYNPGATNPYDLLRAESVSPKPAHPMTPEQGLAQPDGALAWMHGDGLFDGQPMPQAAPPVLGRR